MPKVDIWMPIYIGDYLRDTEELTGPEHGAYLLLLMHYWQKKGEIGCNVERLARVARSEVETARFILGYYFELIDGNYKNNRADEEMKKAQSRRESAIENGKRGGRPPKINPQKTDGFSTDNRPVSQTKPEANPRKSSSSSPTPTPSNKEEEGEAASPVPAEPLPPARLSPMKNETAEYWQEIITQVQPSSTWSNYGKERKALSSLASRTRTLFSDVTGYGLETDLALDVLREFVEMRELSRDKLIRGSPIIPSKILQFWPEITTSMAEKRRAEAEAQILSAMEVF